MLSRSGVKVLLVGMQLKHRAFNGSNQALPWLASALNNDGYTNVLQYDLENPSNTIEDLLYEAESSNLIAFAGTFSTQLDQVDSLATKIRLHLKVKGKQRVPIILGGYGACGVQRFSEYAPDIDAYYFGPGVSGIIKIVESIAHGTFWETLHKLEIRGLSYFDKKSSKFKRGLPAMPSSSEELGEIDQTFNRTHISSIHDMKDIFFDDKGKALKTFQLVTELGCPHACSFCSESGAEHDQMFMGRKVQEVPIATIEDAFLSAKQHGYQAVYFDIETAFRNWRRMEIILELMSKYGLVGGLNTRIDTATKDRIRRCGELGIVYQFYGVEHLSPQVLLAVDKFSHRDLKKRLTAAISYRKKTRDAFRWMNSFNIQSSLFLIMGLPKITTRSWEKLLNEDIDEREIKYCATTLEDDLETIEQGFKLTNPKHFNANILRFNPDTSIAWQSRFNCIRPTKENTLDAVSFVPRVASKLGVSTQEFHPIYRFFEGCETNQPFSTAITPERAYRTASLILELACKYKTHVYFDSVFSDAGLIKHNHKTNKYIIAPLKEFGGLPLTNSDIEGYREAA